MYKIYINDTPLWLIPQSAAAEFFKLPGENLIARYPGKAKFLLNYVDMLEKGGKFDQVVIHAPDVEQLFHEFGSHFLTIEAAGGLVFDPANHLLMIYRRGFWDLPKGKIDPGESPEGAGVREVEEETGVSDITLQSFFETTYHTYKDGKGRRVLKKTYWYVMRGSNQLLTPQAEEDIEEAKWIDGQEMIKLKSLTYPNIRDLIDKWMDTNRSSGTL